MDNRDLLLDHALDELDHILRHDLEKDLLKCIKDLIKGDTSTYVTFLKENIVRLKLDNLKLKAELDSFKEKVVLSNSSSGV